MMLVEVADASDSEGLLPIRMLCRPSINLMGRCNNRVDRRPAQTHIIGNLSCRKDARQTRKTSEAAKVFHS